MHDFFFWLKLVPFVLVIVATVFAYALHPLFENMFGEKFEDDPAAYITSVLLGTVAGLISVWTSLGFWTSSGIALATSIAFGLIFWAAKKLGKEKPRSVA